jgi:FG-GAP-like repeat
VSSYGPAGLAVGDLNGDGKPDIVVTNFGFSGTVSVLLNNGNGTFGAKADYAAGHYPKGVTLADLRGTGKDDIIVGDYYNDAETSGGVSVLLNNGSGTGFSRTSYTTGGYGTTGVAVGDLHGNGKLDIVAAVGNFSGLVSVLPGNGNGTFGARNDYATDSYPYSVAVADVNGDGKLDIVTANDNFNGTVSVLLNNGNGTFAAHKDNSTGSDTYHFGYSNLVLADFNGDNLPDIATANYYNSNVSVLLNQTSSIRLELQDPGGTVVRTATTGPTNVDLATSDFVAPVSGTYYVHFTGVGRRDYNLVITTNAEFMHTPNNTFATAQDITGTAGALGNLGGAGNTLVLNAADSGWWDNTGSHTATNKNYLVGQFSGTDWHDYFVFNLSGVTLAVVGAQLKIFNPASGYGSDFPSDTYGVFSVSTPISSLEATGSGQIGIFNDLISGTSFGSQTVSAASNGQIVTVTLNAAALAALNGALGSPFAVGGDLTSLVDGNSQYLFSGSGNAGDARQLVLTLAPPPEWYKETVSSGQTLTFSTTTPFDDPDATLPNTLSLHIQLYDPSGNFIADGTKLAEGRNETLTYTATVTGAYRIRVTAENGTTGSYFLDPVEVDVNSSSVAALTPTDLPAAGGVRRFEPSSDALDPVASSSGPSTSFGAVGQLPGAASGVLGNTVLSPGETGASSKPDNLPTLDEPTSVRVETASSSNASLGAATLLVGVPAGLTPTAAPVTAAATTSPASPPGRAPAAVSQRSLEPPVGRLPGGNGSDTPGRPNDLMSGEDSAQGWFGEGLPEQALLSDSAAAFRRDAAADAADSGGTGLQPVRTGCKPVPQGTRGCDTVLTEIRGSDAVAGSATPLAGEEADEVSPGLDSGGRLAASAVALGGYLATRARGRDFRKRQVFR